MIEVYSKALDKSLNVERLIGSLRGEGRGPTLIFFGGIHGNEPAGVFALCNILKKLKQKKLSFKGNIFAICGNLNALAKGIRYKKEDLNRLWTSEKVLALEKKTRAELSEEEIEQQELYSLINDILNQEDGPFYFFDLHTTSSETIPFITVNDSLLNRKFTKQYPVPMILGLEEFLEGPLLSFINELGYVSFGFESGQHDSPASIKNHISFIYLSLVFSGCLKRSQIEYQKHYNLLFKDSLRSQQIYEIYLRHEIKESEEFKMEPGFINFQPIKRGQKLAKSNENIILASASGRIFMPLYQGKGNDGFFEIRSVPKVFLNLSLVLRKFKFDHLLPLLPGVRWASSKKNELVVNLKIARLFTRQFFHLLGYRSKQLDKAHLRVKNREAASRKNEYKNTSWMN